MLNIYAVFINYKPKKQQHRVESRDRFMYFAAVFWANVSIFFEDLPHIYAEYSK